MHTTQLEQATAYRRVQASLFLQIQKFIQMSLVITFAIALVLLFLPGIDRVVTAIFIIVNVIITTILEITRRLTIQGAVQHGIPLFVVTTLLVGCVFCFVLRLSGFLIVFTTEIVVISALLHGTYLAISIAIAGSISYAVLELAMQQNWLSSQIDLPLSILLFRIALSSIGIIVLATISVVVSKRLQHVSEEVGVRADESERERAAQVALNAELALRLDEQRRLLELVQELEVPIVPLLPGVVVLPLVGHLDTQRMQTLQQRLVEYVFTQHSSLALIDITGITAVDATIAQALLQMAQSVRLLGATLALTGLRPAVALELITLQTHVEMLKTYATIENALNDYINTRPLAHRQDRAQSISVRAGHI